MYAIYLQVRMGRVQENNYFFLHLTKLTVVLLGHQLLVSRFTGSHLFLLFKAPSVFVKTSTSPIWEFRESSDQGKSFGKINEFAAIAFEDALCRFTLGSFL